MSLSGKTLFITGASRGIGLAIALRAARDGANIAVAAKTAEPHPKLAGTIHTAAARRSSAPAAGRCRSSWTCATRRAWRRRCAAAPKPSAASTSASTTPRRSTWRRPREIDMRRYDLIQQINTRGTFVTSRACLPYLKRARESARADAVAAARPRAAVVRARTWRTRCRSTACRCACWGWPRSIAASRHRLQRALAAHHDRDRGGGVRARRALPCCAARASPRSWRTRPT